MEATTCKYLEVAHLPLKEIKLSLGISRATFWSHEGGFVLIYIRRAALIWPGENSGFELRKSYENPTS